MSSSGESNPPRSSLCIDRSDSFGDANDSLDASAKSLRQKVLEIVRENKAAPDYTIRPSILSQRLGLSINEANSELCGLLQAVGEGSSFHFETLHNGAKSMVFVFPPDFERKALREQRRDDWMSSLIVIGEMISKGIKVLTAFGLILSVIIVSIAGLFAMVAAFVALSRAGGDSRGTRTHLSRQMRNIFLTVRQFLWCYAMFSPVGESSDQDPFFREAAYDTWLLLSLCCGNPGSIFFWWRASHLRHRRQRHRYSRGWGRTIDLNDDDDAASEVEGVSLIRRNRWTGEEERIPVVASRGEHRGLLSSLVEFLFGPNSQTKPTEADKWRLRSAVIVEKASKSRSRSISLQELAPYADSPPSSLDEKFQVIREGLAIVAHFNGVPSYSSTDTNESSERASFDFPELVGEGHGDANYDDPLFWEQNQQSFRGDSRWEGFFYRSEGVPGSSESLVTTAR
ncbi:MAG: hypothetical protein SGILL_009689, partial [Bacillariaceae sp.]